ncbi:hypothetical protein [Microbacterium sp. PMB16]|uniref:hypothetical protein n=1 Tax=Microbacterium sp. PMB16 TaxID=3120157 RepID=UPI003F4C33F4
MTGGNRNILVTTGWALLLSWVAGTAVQLGVFVHGTPFDLESTIGALAWYQIFSIPLTFWAVGVVLLAVVLLRRLRRRWLVLVGSFGLTVVAIAISIAMMINITSAGSDTTTLSTLPETVVALIAFHSMAWGAFASSEAVTRPESPAARA